MQHSRPREDLTQIWITKEDKKQIRELKRKLKKSQVQVVEEIIEFYLSNKDICKKQG